MESWKYLNNKKDRANWGMEKIERTENLPKSMYNNNIKCQ